MARRQSDRGGGGWLGRKTASIRRGWWRQPLTCCTMWRMTREPGQGLPCFANVLGSDVALARGRRRERPKVDEFVAVPSARVVRARGEDEDVPGRGGGYAEFKGDAGGPLGNVERRNRVIAEDRALGRIHKRGQAEQGLVAVDGGEEHLPGQRAGLAATGMATDLLADVTPGVPLLIGQAAPAERGVAKGRLAAALRGGGAPGARGMRTLALAKPGLEGNDVAALPALRGVECFHRVMLFHAAAEGTARLPTVAYAAG